MPYRRRQRSQKKHAGKGKVSEHILKKLTPEKRSLVQYGLIPESVKHPITHQPLTKKLASSAKHERDSGISTVRSILSKQNTQMDKTKMTQLWKALFYSFWMSDKVLIQHELARKLSNFIKLCTNDNISLLYIECFMECMSREWSGIDFLRMNKFLSLVRYFIHSCFDYFALNEWNLQLIKKFSNILINNINLSNSSNRGLFFHLNDIYIDELVKINRIDSDTHLHQSIRMPITFDALYNILLPFIRIYLNSNKVWQQQYVIRKIFNSLLETMTFDKEEREALLTRPGANDIDLYQFNIVQNNKTLVNNFIYDSDNENENEKDRNNISRDKLSSNSKKMRRIDPRNPVRRKKLSKFLSFDKKNYDVVMPFKEFERGIDVKMVKEWENRFSDMKVKRINDPLLLKDKMEQFQKIFKYLAYDENTPKKAKRKLSVLAKMFILKDDNDKYYDRERVKDALKLVDNTQLLRKFSRMKKRRKKIIRRKLKNKMKWNKMKKKGIKIKPNKKLLKRAAKMIV